jgi:hypothetical protein
LFDISVSSELELEISSAIFFDISINYEIFSIIDNNPCKKNRTIMSKQTVLPADVLSSENDVFVIYN